MTIKTIDIIHHSHFDLGYTDHPVIALELQKRYIDMALDAIHATSDRKEGERFCWTAEALYPVYEWWKEASRDQRDRLIEAIRSGQFEVTGFPFNNTLFFNEDQWDKLSNWIPDELWKAFGPRCGMQIDVNGVSIAGMMRAVQKGIAFLWVGPNRYLGRTPFDTPSVFHWKMPDGNTVFVWVNPVYCNGFGLFHENWRQGPVPAASDLCYRAPERGDFFSAKEADVLKAHRRCREQLEWIHSDSLMNSKHAGEGDTRRARPGFEFERLPVSMTNQWRMDNDPPFPPLADFVAKWNEMGLTPGLRLTTPSVALQDLKAEIRTPIPECSGEWIDWWSNGMASVPVEWAASRKAKRILQSLKSPFLGPFDEKEHGKRDRILRDLCLFDEHTFGSWASVGSPYSDASRGQAFEKGGYAYRALAQAEMLLADRMRSLLKDAPQGIAVANTSHAPVSGWVSVPANCLRGNFGYVRNRDTGVVRKLAYLPGPAYFSRTPEASEQISMTNVSRTWPDLVPGQTVRFWSGCIPSQSVRYFELLDAAEGDRADPVGSDPSGRHADHVVRIETDPSAWPESLTWRGMERGLIDRGFGDFFSVGFTGPMPRTEYVELFGALDEPSRREKIAKSVRKEPSQTVTAEIVEDTPFSITFEQRFDHPSLAWGLRRLEVWKEEPRARLCVTINRRSSMNPEVFYIRLPIPCEKTVPSISNGGHIFKPGEGQIPGSCMEYYAIDDGVHYASEQGHWILTCKDSALIAFDEHNPTAALRASIEHPERLLSIVFDNTWDTNFRADSHGVMEFTYDLRWVKRLKNETEAREIAQSLSSDWVVAVKV